ncbi:MAG: class II glutamine amidotransferase [Candidatus Korarchaeum sp.]
MCRLLLLAGSDGASASRLLRAFSEASRCDPYLAELRGDERCLSHDDGWGYALIGYRGGKHLSKHYRSVSPVFEDTELGELTALLGGLDGFLLIAHSRKSSKGGAEVRNTHPFHYSYLGFELWIAHNGTVDDRRIAEERCWNYDGDLSDTHYLGRYVYESLSSSSVARAFSKASKFLKEGSAMNTVSLVSGDIFRAVVTCLYRAKNESYERYYRLFELREERLMGAVSSTIEYYAEDSRFSELQNGKGLTFEVRDEGGGEISLSREAFDIEDPEL